MQKGTFSRAQLPLLTIVFAVVLLLPVSSAAALSKVLADGIPIENGSAGMSRVIGQTGQSFTAIDGTLDSVAFSLSPYRTPTGSAYVDLYAHSGTYGVDGVPTGTVLATSAPFDLSTLGTYGGGLAVFTFDNTVQLTAGAHYVAVLRYGDGGLFDPQKPGLFIRSAARHPGGSCGLYEGVWYGDASDLVFSVYEMSDWVNHPPVLSPIGDKSVAPLTKLTFTATATDADGDWLEFSLLQGPWTASLTPDGVFTWTPSATDAGVNRTVKIAVRDVHGGTASETLQVTVLGTKSATTLSFDVPSTCAFGSAKVSGSLKDVNGKALSGKQVKVEYLSAGSWKTAKTVYTTTAGEYAATVNPKVKTTYRASFAGDAGYVGESTAGKVVLPRVRLTRLSVWDTKSHGTTNYYRGYVEPNHSTSDPNKVQFKMYKKGSDGAYHWNRTVSASYSYYSASKTKWTAKVVFPSAGKWRVKAYHAEDSRNASTSSSYDYLTVK